MAPLFKFGGHGQILQTLLENGAHFNLQVGSTAALSKRYHTVLHLDNKKTVQLLLTNGAKGSSKVDFPDCVK